MQVVLATYAVWHFFHFCDILSPVATVLSSEDVVCILRLISSDSGLNTMFSPKFLAQQGMQQVSESFYSQGMSRNDIPPKKTMFHFFWCVLISYQNRTIHYFIFFSSS